MGTRIIANDVTAPWYSKVIPPVTRGLEAWFTFNTDAARFNVNRAIGKENGIIVGNPVAYPTHGRFKGLANYIQTQISETDQLTIVVVGKAANAIPAGASSTGDANTPFYAGNHRGESMTPGYTGQVYGSAIYHVLPDATGGGSSKDNGAGGFSNYTVSLAGETPTSWAIRTLRVGPSGTDSIINSTRNAKADRLQATPRVLSSNKMRIGSGTTGFAAEVDIAAVAIYSVALTDAELALVADALRKHMAALGVTV